MGVVWELHGSGSGIGGVGVDVCVGCYGFAVCAVVGVRMRVCLGPLL